MMLNGVVAGGGGGGGGTYTAPAVHFDGSVTLSLPSLTASPTNGFISYALWFKMRLVDFNINEGMDWFNGGDAGGCVGGLEHVGSLDTTPRPQTYGFSDDGQLEYSPIFDSITLDQWLVNIVTMNCGVSPGVTYSYINDTKLGLYPDPLDDTPFNLVFNGEQFTIGNGGFGTDNMICDIANLWIAPGADWSGGGGIPLAIRRNFIDGNGKPVNPTVAIANLGQPAILLSGDASTFSTNQGSGGAFSTSGVLTNASTSPSN